MMGKSRIPEYLYEMIAMHPGMQAQFTYPGKEQDRLFDTITTDQRMLAILVKPVD